MPRWIATTGRAAVGSGLTLALALGALVPWGTARAATGELEGSGAWTLWSGEGATHIRYDWNVRTTRWWMNLLAPVARPLFARNHDIVMEWGRVGLESELGVPVASHVEGG